MEEGIDTQIKREALTLVTRYGRHVRIQNIDGQVGSLRFIVPPVKPPITVNFVRPKGGRHPSSLRFKNVNFDSSIIDVPTVFFDVGV